MDEKKQVDDGKVRWTGYVILVIAILFFSGLFNKAEGPLRALDFSNLLGSFGKLGTLTEGSGKIASTIKGDGGTGPRDAFMFGLTLIPGIMFALGFIKVVENLDGMKAASKLLSPLMKVLLGLPGSLGLAVIANLQSSDTSAVMTKELYDQGVINEKEKIIYTAYQFPAPATILNYFTIGTILFIELGDKFPIILPLVIILFCKFLGANVIRLFINKIVKDGN